MRCSTAALQSTSHRKEIELKGIWKKQGAQSLNLPRNLIWILIHLLRSPPYSLYSFLCSPCCKRQKISSTGFLCWRQTRGPQQKKVHAGKRMTSNTCETCCVNMGDRCQSVRLQLSLSYKFKTRKFWRRAQDNNVFSQRSAGAASTCWAHRSKSVTRHVPCGSHDLNTGHMLSCCVISTQVVFIIK